MFKVDLNSDLGESFGVYKMGMDEEILKFVSSVNVACGFHAGDPCVMDKTLNLAKQNNVCIGAHPSYPDLLGFGRRDMQISFEEAKNYALYQLGALFGFAKAKDMKIQHFKAHGALYNMAVLDENIIFLGLSNSAMNEAAKKKGLRYANEVFADRAYNDDGTLVSRKLEGALIHDENLAIKRVIKMIKESKVTSINGKEIDLKADSICVHGDGIKALEFVKKIKENLTKEQIQIKALNDFIN